MSPQNVSKANALLDSVVDSIQAPRLKTSSALSESRIDTDIAANSSTDLIPNVTHCVMRMAGSVAKVWCALLITFVIPMSDHLASALVVHTSVRILLFVPSIALQSNLNRNPQTLLSVSCARVDLQVSAMAQICSGLSGTGVGLVHANFVLPVEEPVLGFHQSELSARTCASASSHIAITHLRTTLT
jgi:hypothetical protein